MRCPARTAQSKRAALHLFLHEAYKIIEQKRGIQRAAAGLRMKLNGESGLMQVGKTFVCAVVYIDEQLFRVGL